MEPAIFKWCEERTSKGTETKHGKSSVLFLILKSFDASIEIYAELEGFNQELGFLDRVGVKPPRF